MGGLGALQSNCQHQDEGLSGAVSDHHALLCWVCFFVWWGACTPRIPSQPGRKSEKQWKTTWCLSTGLGSVLGSLFASEKLGKRFWTLVSDPPPGKLTSYSFRWVGTSVLGSVNGSITQPGISRENRSLNLTDISLWSFAKWAQYTVMSLSFTPVFFSKSEKQGNWRNSQRPRFLL